MAMRAAVIAAAVASLLVSACAVGPELQVRRPHPRPMAYTAEALPGATAAPRSPAARPSALMGATSGAVVDAVLARRNSTRLIARAIEQLPGHRRPAGGARRVARENVRAAAGRVRAAGAGGVRISSAPRSAALRSRRDFRALPPASTRPTSTSSYTLRRVRRRAAARSRASRPRSRTSISCSRRVT